MKNARFGSGLFTSKGALCVAFVLTAAACGGSDGGGGGGDGDGDGDGVDSGLPGDKVASDLTDTEAAQLCDSLQGQSSGFDEAEMTCTAAGVLIAQISLSIADPELPPSDQELRDACQDSYDSCIADEQPAEPDSGQMCDADTFAGCSATVSEIEDCIDETNAAAEEFFQAVPRCSELTAENVADFDITDSIVLAPSCSALNGC